jgi:hypothetical protein
MKRNEAGTNPICVRVGWGARGIIISGGEGSTGFTRLFAIAQSDWQDLSNYESSSDTKTNGQHQKSSHAGFNLNIMMGMVTNVYGKAILRLGPMKPCTLSASPELSTKETASLRPWISNLR